MRELHRLVELVGVDVYQNNVFFNQAVRIAVDSGLQGEEALAAVIRAQATVQEAILKDVHSIVANSMVPLTILRTAP